jgi:hypothetical protein
VPGREVDLARKGVSSTNPVPSQSSPSIVVGGCLSEVTKWNGFAESAKRLLAPFGLTTFHMTDCSNGAKPYDAMSNDERKSLIKNMIELTFNHTDMIFARFLQRSDYDNLTDRQKAAIGSDYSFLMIEAIADATEWVRLKRKGAALSVSCEESDYYGEVFERYKKSRKKGKGLANYLRGVQDETKEATPELWAADIAMYEVRKRMAGLYDDDRTDDGKPRRMRKSLDRLMALPNSIMGYYKDLLIMRADIYLKTTYDPFFEDDPVQFLEPMTALTKMPQRPILYPYPGLKALPDGRIVPDDNSEAAPRH